jgi:hypothetical protein
MTPFKVIPHMPSRSLTTIYPTTLQGTPNVAWKCTQVNVAFVRNGYVNNEVMSTEGHNKVTKMRARCWRFNNVMRIRLEIELTIEG